MHFFDTENFVFFPHGLGASPGGDRRPPPSPKKWKKYLICFLNFLFCQAFSVGSKALQGGFGPPPPKKLENSFFNKKLSRVPVYVFVRHFLHHSTWGAGNTLGLGMQLYSGVRIGHYWGVWVQLSQGARGDIGAFTQPCVWWLQGCTST